MSKLSTQIVKILNLQPIVCQSWIMWNVGLAHRLKVNMIWSAEQFSKGSDFSSGISKMVSECLGFIEFLDVDEGIGFEVGFEMAVEINCEVVFGMFAGSSVGAIFGMISVFGVSEVRIDSGVGFDSDGV